MSSKRTTRLYDHRLVRAVQTSRDTSIATQQEVPAPAARGWLLQAPRSVRLSADDRARRCATCA